MKPVANCAPKTTKPALAAPALQVSNESFVSVANGDAGNIGALQRLADRFGLIALEAGEAGAEQLAIILGNDRLGERIGLAQKAAGLVPREIDPGTGLSFAFQRADLDDPAAVGDGGGGRNRLLLNGLR